MTLLNVKKPVLLCSGKNSHQKQLSPGLRQNNPSILSDLLTEREKGDHNNNKGRKIITSSRVKLV